MATQMAGGKPRFGAIRKFADGGVVKEPPPTSFRGLFNSAKNAISNAMAPETAAQGQARRAAEYEAMKAKYGQQPVAQPAQPQPSVQPGVGAGLDGAGGSSVDKRLQAAGAYARGGKVGQKKKFLTPKPSRQDSEVGGAKIKGPGTATSDSIDGEVVETGEPIRVANGERILSVDQDRYLRTVADRMGYPSVDAMLEDGTGKPVGPTVKYVPGGALRGASSGMAAEESYNGQQTTNDHFERNIQGTGTQTNNQEARMYARGGKVKAGSTSRSQADEDPAARWARLKREGVRGDTHVPKDSGPLPVDLVFNRAMPTHFNQVIEEYDKNGGDATRMFAGGGEVENLNNKIGEALTDKFSRTPPNIPDKSYYDSQRLAAVYDEQHPATGNVADKTTFVTARTPSTSVAPGSTWNEQKTLQGMEEKEQKNGMRSFSAGGDVALDKERFSGYANGGSVVAKGAIRRGFEDGGMPDQSSSGPEYAKAMSEALGKKWSEPYGNIPDPSYYRSIQIGQNYFNSHPLTANHKDYIRTIVANSGASRSLEAFQEDNANLLRMQEAEEKAQAAQVKQQYQEGVDGKQANSELQEQQPMYANGGRVVAKGALRRGFEDGGTPDDRIAAIADQQKAQAAQYWQNAGRPDVSEAARDAVLNVETPTLPKPKPVPPVQSTYPDESTRAPAVDTRPPAPANSGRTVTDLGNGISRIDQPGKSPLFTNLSPDDPSNVALMNRGQGKTPDQIAQNQMAMDNLQARQDARDQAARNQLQYQSEVASAQAFNEAQQKVADKIHRQYNDKPLRDAAETTLASKYHTSPEQKQAALKTIDSLNKGRLEAAARADREALFEETNRVLAQQYGDQRADQRGERQARGALDKGRFAIEQAREARDANNYAQQQAQRARLEGLHAAYEKAPAGDRDAIEQQIRVLSGKDIQPQFKSHVMPAVKNADGSTTEGGVYVENTRTGQGQWVKNTQPNIASDQRAIAIRDDKSMSVEQKRAALQKLGYQ